MSNFVGCDLKKKMLQKQKRVEVIHPTPTRSFLEQQQQQEQIIPPQQSHSLYPPPPPPPRRVVNLVPEIELGRDVLSNGESTGQHLLIMEGACPWHYSTAAYYLKNEGWEGKCIILVYRCSAKSVTLREFYSESDKFGTAPWRATCERDGLNRISLSAARSKGRRRRRGGHNVDDEDEDEDDMEEEDDDDQVDRVFVPIKTLVQAKLTLNELAENYEAAIRARDLRHAFWGITWIQAYAITLATQPGSVTPILVEQVAHGILYAFADEDESLLKMSTVVEDVILPLTNQFSPYHSWLNVDDWGRLSVGPTSLQSVDPSDLSKKLLPWTIFGMNDGLGPLLPTLLLDEWFHGERYDEGELISYFKLNLQEGVDHLPLSKRSESVWWGKKSREGAGGSERRRSMLEGGKVPQQQQPPNELGVLTFAARIPFNRRLEATSTEDSTEFIPIGKYRWLCTEETAAQLQEELSNEFSHRFERASFLIDGGSTKTFKSTEDYVLWWIEEKITRILEVENAKRKDNGILDFARKFSMLLTKGYKVPAIDAEDSDEQVALRLFFLEDRNDEERRSSLELEFENQFKDPDLARVFVNLPVSILTKWQNNVPDPNENLSSCARDIYFEMLVEHEKFVTARSKKMKNSKTMSERGFTIL